MKKRLIALGYYSIFWLAFFFIARLFFIAFQYSIAFQNRVAGLLGTFWHGAKLDISTTGYFLLVPVLVALPGVWLNGNWYKFFIRWYTYLVIILSGVYLVSFKK